MVTRFCLTNYQCLRSQRISEARWEAAEVAVGQLAEAGGNGPELFEPAETALDDVAGLALLGIEGRGSAAGRPTPLSARNLGSPFRDDRSDTAPS